MLRLKETGLHLRSDKAVTPQTNPQDWQCCGGDDLGYQNQYNYLDNQVHQYDEVHQSHYQKCMNYEGRRASCETEYYLCNGFDPGSPSSSRTSVSRPENSSVATTATKLQKRTVFTLHQMTELKKEFQDRQHLTRLETIHLAKALNLTEAQVKAWFANRRVNFKKDIYKAAAGSTPARSYNIMRSFNQFWK